MTEVTYPYTYPTDFTQGQGYDTVLLSYQIKVDNSITTPLLRVSPDYTTINLIFGGTLSGGEETALDAVVAAHDPSTQSVPVGDNMYQILSPSSSTTSNNSWAELGTFIWDNTQREIVSSRFISYLSGAGTYGIRLYNISEANVVTTMTGMNNDITSIQSFNDNTVVNQPTNISILSIQGLVSNSGSTANLQSFELTYN